VAPNRGAGAGTSAERFNRNDHRNWFDPGNDCQKAANMASCDDDADLAQRREVRQPALPARAVSKIPRQEPARGSMRRPHAIAVSAGGARLSPAPSRLGKAAQPGWTRKAVAAEAAADVLAAGAAAGRNPFAPRPFTTRFQHASRPPRHAVCAPQ